jgi:hypothetical protein
LAVKVVLHRNHQIQPLLDGMAAVRADMETVAGIGVLEAAELQIFERQLVLSAHEF